ncbi:tetratricopeptide repeat protein, partial [Leptolyngbya sp. FACHB-36]|uniref:tetratricopeptide repeat protein n=1 Tax=Leptolyngbya sp. FACHB-36 TaxID=2692808 RepID=UPI0016808499
AMVSQPHPASALSDLIQATIAQAGNSPSDSDIVAIDLLEQIETLHQQSAPRAMIAAAYQTLGNLYRDRIEQGDSAEQILMIAICAYEQTLVWLEESSPLWADVLNDLGNLYWMLSRYAASSELVLSWLEQGITAYQLALSQTDPQVRPQSYAMIQNNLGSAFGDLARYRSPAQTLQQSIQAYEEALRYRKPEDDPARYAATQNNLGTAYWNLAQHEQPVRRLKQAIAAYSEALHYYSQTRDPLHHAMIQNNLGTAYWNLAQYDSANQGADAMALLSQAIAAYRTALVHRTLDAAPTAHAATQNNLGTAYWHLATQTALPPDQRPELLQQAIAAYTAALTAVRRLQSTGTGVAFDPIATENNLGLAYYQRAIDKHAPCEDAQRSRYLEAALHHHLQAMQAWSDQPEFYKTALGYVVQTVRAFYSEFGIKGQQLALSKVPANLLPELMKRV